MNQPETTISQGTLRGSHQSGVDAYLGVPFAAPPERFKAPGPPDKWDGVRDATRSGPAAPQPPSRLAEVIGARTQDQSEDCLSLNVWTPSEPSGPRPVFVFLHGGGFSSGSGSLDWYDGAALARRGDLVVVTVNYRLGALGFFRLEQANVGLLDQIQALRWVQENIAAFGGDPGAVTVAGQSAGAISILAMLSGRAADGLFHRAIVQSAPGGLRPLAPAEADAIANEFRQAVGTDPYTASVSDILAAQLELVRLHPGVIPPYRFVAEGGVVAEDIVLGAGTQGANGVQILMGTTRDEANAHGGDPRVTAELFEEPMHQLADLLALAANPAWLYRFDWSPAGNPFGACHCIELPFVFGNLDACRDAPLLAGADDESLAAMVEVVQPAWISFVHNGNPGWPVAAVQHLELS
ncbi:carboxylesterase family protein [Kribbella soli]